MTFVDVTLSVPDVNPFTHPLWRVGYEMITVAVACGDEQRGAGYLCAALMLFERLKREDVEDPAAEGSANAAFDMCCRLAEVERMGR